MNKKGLYNHHKMDIHMHCLAFADDGAKSLDESVEMLKIAVAEGITAIIVTPHYKPTHLESKVSLEAQEIVKKVGLLREKAEGLQMPMKLYVGNELYFHAELPELLAKKRVCTLADSKYVLIEFSPQEEYSYIKNGLYTILMGGHIPILAHVERYQSIWSKKESMQYLRDMGSYFQINSGSVIGQFGWETKKVVKSMLKKKLVHFVATDAHNSRNRPPKMKECETYLTVKYGLEYTRQLLFENPQKVINNENLK